MRVDAEQIAGIVLGGLILQGVLLAVGFVAFRSEMNAHIRELKDTTSALKRALGLDGGGIPAFPYRHEFEAFAEQTREVHKELRDDLVRVDGVLERHSEAIQELRRKGA